MAFMSTAQASRLVGRCEAWRRLPWAWAERHAFRRDLARMDEHLWDDLGLGPDEARAEIAKPFWVP